MSVQTNSCSLNNIWCVISIDVVISHRNELSKRPVVTFENHLCYYMSLPHKNQNTWATNDNKQEEYSFWNSLFNAFLVSSIHSKYSSITSIYHLCGP